MTFVRNCPECSKEINHKSERTCKRAHEKKTLCCSCVKRRLWARDDSPLRSEETRKKRNEGVSRARLDPNCVIHSKEYHERSSALHRELRADPSGSYQTLEFRENLSKGVRKAMASPDYKGFSKETKEKVRKKTLEHWTPERRKQFGVEQKARWVKIKPPWEYQDWLGAQVSKLELSMSSSLSQFGFLHSSEHKIRVGSFTPDFLNIETKTIIEIHGDFWHANPTHNIFGNSNWQNPFSKQTSNQIWERDEERISFLESQGYKVITIWESEIKNGTWSLSGSK